jgi:hypothetical protein
MGKIVTFGLTLVVSSFMFIGCGGGLSEPANEVVTGGEIVVSFSGESIKNSLISAGTPGVDVNTTVYGYKAYKIPYTTTDEEGNAVSVSGLMVVPTGLPDIVYSTLGLSLVSDDHGTIFGNREAPSVIASTNNTPDGSPIILTSLGGFVTLQPDYIGFGNSLGHYHPFILKNSLANATVDFIVAARTFATNNNINLNGQLFLTGYSEGGYAAMATLEKIENDGVLTVAMAAPMAGPYTVEGLATTILQDVNLSVPSFMANVGYAYAKAYTKDIATVINEPYASRLPTLFNGDFIRAEIDPQLTIVTTGASGLFNPTFRFDVLTNSNNWFRQAARANDVYNWAPITPVKLVHCIGDDVIPYTISEATNNAMNLAGGVDVSLVPVEIAVTGNPATALRYGHGACGSVAYGVTTNIFAQVRATTIGY